MIGLDDEDAPDGTPRAAINQRSPAQGADCAQEQAPEEMTAALTEFLRMRGLTSMRSILKTMPIVLRSSLRSMMEISPCQPLSSATVPR